MSSSLKPRWMLHILIGSTVAVILFSLCLLLPSTLVNYHLARIAANQDMQVHIKALYQMGRLAHNELLSRLEADAATTTVDDETWFRESDELRRRAACVLLMSRAYNEKTRSQDNFRRFLKIAFLPNASSIRQRVVPCLLLVSIKWPTYWSVSLRQACKIF